MAAKITITKTNSGTTLTTYQINNFKNVLFNPVNTPDIIADPTGDETTAVTIKFTGTQLKISIDFQLVAESANVITGGVLTQNTSSGANSATTLNDTNQNWAVNQWANETVTITGGTGNGADKYTILSNTATQLTVAAWNHGTPDATSTYTINVTTSVGQSIYLVKQFNSIALTTQGFPAASQSIPLVDKYALTFDYGETNARTFTENGTLGNIMVNLASDNPVVFDVHMDFLIGTTPA